MITISKKFKKVASVSLAAALLVTGIAVPKKLQKVDAASAIDLSKVKIKSESIVLDSFTNYDITGEIKSDRSLVKVTCSVKDGKTGQTVQEGVWPYSSSEKKAQSNGTKKLNLKDTKINKKLISFKYLSGDKFTLKITAENKKGVVAEKTIAFAIKEDIKNYVVGVYNRAFANSVKVSDEDAAMMYSDIYVDGAKTALKYFFASDLFNTKNASNEDFVEGAYYAATGTLAPESVFRLYVNRLKSGSSRAEVAEMIINTPAVTNFCAACGVRPNR